MQGNHKNKENGSYFLDKLINISNTKRAEKSIKNIYLCILRFKHKNSLFFKVSKHQSKR